MIVGFFFNFMGQIVNRRMTFVQQSKRERVGFIGGQRSSGNYRCVRTFPVFVFKFGNNGWCSGIVFILKSKFYGGYQFFVVVMRRIGNYFFVVFTAAGERKGGNSGK